MARPALALACLLVSSAALAAPEPALLRPLPRERLAELAPILQSADLALVESDERGRLRQISVILWTAAPPARVREVVAQPERYPEFVRALTRSSVKRLPGGSLDHTFTVSYSIQTVEGTHRFEFLPAEPGQAAGPIELYEPENPGYRRYRWEFLPALGGTVVVLYGFTRFPSDGLIGRLLQSAPILEHGLALITQMTWGLSMRQRAEALSGPLPAPPAAKAGGYGFLLERGPVALFRARGGRVTELSLVTRVAAPGARLIAALAQPSAWSGFVPSISRSGAAPEGEGAVDIEQSVPLLSFRTVWGLRREAAALDMLGLRGDHRGARLRFDVQPEGAGASRLVMRTNQAYDRSSVVVRQLYKLEPLFEYGVDMGLGFLLLQGLKQRAELAR